jgi:Zn-dependent alcohol dehydrogenase
MKINGEEADLVTDFSQLHAGMIVLVKACRWCRKCHRGMLTSCMTGVKTRFPNGTRIMESIWRFLPATGCDASNCLGMTTVDEKRVYRIVDRLLDADTVTHSKELAR